MFFSPIRPLATAVKLALPLTVIALSGCNSLMTSSTQREVVRPSVSKVSRSSQVQWLTVATALLLKHKSPNNNWTTAAGRYHRPAGGVPAKRYRQAFARHLTRLTRPNLQGMKTHEPDTNTTRLVYLPRTTDRSDAGRSGEPVVQRHPRRTDRR